MTSSDEKRRRRVTVPQFSAMKQNGQKISVLTAYDYPTARLVDAAGVDAVLVGDSLGMVVQGRSNTLPVTLDQVIYHAEMVARAVQYALVIVDMPFPTFLLGKYKAIENAGRALKETGCQAVKLEGGAEQAETIAALVSAGIPVMAHIGLRPQSIHLMGGHRVQREKEQLRIDAQAAQQAGAFSIVLECIPAEVASQLTAELTIPTIGIGAGAGCDGQVLVLHDVLGLGGARTPRHAKAYADLSRIITDAVTHYVAEVRDGTFPGREQTFE
jgi:3-methyl-2-oxobutanoate hydroxymethyltransferase